MLSVCHCLDLLWPFVVSIDGSYWKELFITCHRFVIFFCNFFFCNICPPPKYTSDLKAYYIYKIKIFLYFHKQVVIILYFCTVLKQVFLRTHFISHSSQFHSSIHIWNGNLCYYRKETFPGFSPCKFSAHLWGCAKINCIIYQNNVDIFCIQRP